MYWGYNEMLELELWWEEGALRFRDRESGKFLPTPVELTAYDRAGDSESRAGAAEARVAELEEKMRRLRGE